MDVDAKLRFHLQTIVSWASDLHVAEIPDESIVEVTMRRRDLVGFQDAVANVRKDFPDINDWVIQE